MSLRHKYLDSIKLSKGIYITLTIKNEDYMAVIEKKKIMQLRANLNILRASRTWVGSQL